MELQDLALCTHDEIEQEIHRIYPDPPNQHYNDEFDQAMEKRIELRETIYHLQIEALLDGRLSIDQVVAQHHNPFSDMSELIDDINRDLLKQALNDLKTGVKSRYEIVKDTAYYLDPL